MGRKRHHGQHPTLAQHQENARMERIEAERLPQIHNLSTFDHVLPSAARGWIPFFARDTSRELTGYLLERARNDSRWAYANIGLATRIIDGLTNHIGYLLPNPVTDDANWNRTALESFKSACFNPAIFDRAGKWDFREWQLGNNRCRFKDGDMLSVLSETQSGIARVIVYEAHQVRSGALVEREGDGFRDGIFLDGFGKMQGFNVIGSELAGEKALKVNVNDAIFFADFKRHGQVRGYPVLSGALNHIQDRSEIWYNWKKNIKDSSEVSFYKKREMPALNNPVTGLFGVVEAKVVGTDSEGRDIKQNVEQLRGAGPGIPNLRVGESLETLHDSRPAPSQQDLVNDIVRDIAWHAGVAPEILWFLSGQTGPSVRFLMADFRRWIEREQLRLRVICQRFWVYYIAKEIKAGRLPMPTDAAWWKCDWLPQSDMTIDVGRESKVTLDQLRHGATTLQTIYHEAGSDARTELTKHIDFLAEMRDYAEAKGFMGLPDVMPGFYQGLPAGIPVEEEEDTETMQEPGKEEDSPPPKKK